MDRFLETLSLTRLNQVICILRKPKQTNKQTNKKNKQKTPPNKPMPSFYNVKIREFCI